MFLTSFSMLAPKVYVYQNVLVIGSSFKKRVFYYHQLDAIISDIEFVKVSVERVTEGDWPNGYVYVVYNLIKDGKTIFTLGANRYKNLTDLETAFTEANPYVESMVNTGLMGVCDQDSPYDQVNITARVGL